MRPRCGYRCSRFHDLRFVLYRARASHDNELVPADLVSVDTDSRTFGAKLAAYELVGSRDADRLLDAWHGFDGLEAIRYIADSDDAYNYPLLAFDGVYLIAEITDALA